MSRVLSGLVQLWLCGPLVLVAAEQAEKPDRWCLVVSAVSAETDAPDVHLHAMTREDYHQIASRVPTILMMVPIRIQPLSISIGDRDSTAPVWGTTLGHWELVSKIARIDQLEGLSEGRFLSNRDNESRSGLAVLGAGIAARLFGESSPIGEQIDIAGHQFTVLGVLAELEATKETRNRVYIPLGTMLARFPDQATAAESPAQRERRAGLSQLWIVVGSSNRDTTWPLVERVLKRNHPTARYRVSYFAVPRAGSR